MSNQETNTPQFFLTAPQPCSYLENHSERKIFTHFPEDGATELNTALTQAGFRRSQDIAYRPACETCNACVSIRVPVDLFQPNGSFRRIVKKNADLVSSVILPETTSEQYSLFRDYLNARHKQGGMDEMSVLDYQNMVEGSPVETYLIEYRKRTVDSFLTTKGGELVATTLTDILDDGLSMVYSFYTPQEQHRSLGSFLILDHIEKTKRLGLPYLYLGFWVKGCRKMEYKIRFTPQEHLTAQGWNPFISSEKIAR